MSSRASGAYALVLTLMIPVAMSAGASPVDDLDVAAGVGRFLSDATSGPDVFLLGFDDKPSASTIKEIRETVDNVLVFRHVPVIAIEATAEQAEALHQKVGSLSVVRDRPLEYDQIPAARTTNWASTGDTETRAGQARALGYDGSGIGVAVVDTGINGVPAHPGLYPDALGGPVLQNVKILLGRGATALDIPSPVNIYLENQPSTDESGGHGTHVAGIIAGHGTDDGRFQGRAAGAHLIGISTGVSTSILYAIAAYDYILEHHQTYNIRVVNNSYGAAGPFQPLDPLVLAIKAADEAGILSVFSASNRGPGERTLNTYAQSPYVLGVGAATPGGAVATFSSRGSPDSGKPGPDLVAPGFLTISARNQAVSALDQSARTPVLDSAAIPFEDLYHYRLISGTSMASPQVAGIAAILLQADPTLTPADLRHVLTATARPLQGFDVIDQGAGLVDAEAALRHVLYGTTTGGDWVRPIVIERDGDIHRYPFHGAAVGADVDLSAFHHENPFPVRTPVEALKVTFDWMPLTAAGALEADDVPLRFTLIAPDGTALVDDAFSNAAARKQTYHVDATAVAAHNKPGWSSGAWNAVVHAAGGVGTYDITADVSYANGELPEVMRAPPPPPPPPAMRVPHDPIIILDDDDFTPENGVVAGTGSPDDPYIIDGWEINPPEGPGLAIGGTGALGEPGAGTSKHVVVRNVRVHDSPNWCVMLDSAHHVTVRDSLFDGCNWALYAKGDTQDLRIIDNAFAFNERAVSLYGVQDVLVQGNTVSDPIDGGIVVSQGVVGLSTNVASSAVRIEANTLRGERGDILVATPGATAVEVVGNRLGAGGDIMLETGTVGNRVSATEWLDGEQRIRQSVLATDPGAIAPVNTIVDAGSDRVAATGKVCFDDARIDAGPAELLQLITWDYGDGSGSEGETNPCHAYQDSGPGPWEAHVVVTFQSAGGERFTLEDRVTVST